jgi:CubicO group peptidase (beta-lactamase class C family)
VTRTLEPTAGIGAARCGCRLNGERHQVKEGESEIVRWFDAELNYIGPSDRGPVGGVSLIGYADGRRHFTSWGWADEEKKMKFSADTMCWIASNTKGIAAAAVLTLIDDGLVSLDDPISKHLPEFANLTVREKDGSVRPAKTVMTLRHVLSHTSGLAFFPGKPCDRRDERPMRLLAHLGAKTPLEFDPGEGFKYSNWGIDVAVAVIEAVTGRPWEERLKNRILQPLEMSDTTFWPDEEQMRRMAKGYAFKADGRRIESSAYPLRDLCGREPRYAEAGGGLFSTANDLYRFFRMIANNGRGENGRRVLSEKVMCEWFSKQTPEAIKKQYSLGMWINPQKNTISHAGAWRTHGFADWKKSTVRLYMVQVVGGNEDTKECGKQWERLSEKL